MQDSQQGTCVNLQFFFSARAGNLHRSPLSEKKDKKLRCDLQTKIWTEKWATKLQNEVDLMRVWQK